MSARPPFSTRLSTELRVLVYVSCTWYIWPGVRVSGGCHALPHGRRMCCTLHRRRPRPMTPALLLAGLGLGFGFGLGRAQTCPDYSAYATQAHPPLTNGTHRLGYMRPDPACRTFNSSDVEAVIAAMAAVVRDPDLYRLFQNAYPNTLDTAIRWRGVAANNSTEELTFLITGDINAM